MADSGVVKIRIKGADHEVEVEAPGISLPVAIRRASELFEATRPAGRGRVGFEPVAGVREG